MGNVSRVGRLQTSRSALRQLTISPVFSAPKYCDMTENKGAYINIGPDYKLKFEQFDAVPHPPIKAMVSSQHSFSMNCRSRLPPSNMAQAYANQSIMSSVM
jgi:hypothetical protein